MKSNHQDVRLSAYESVVTAGENLALQDLLDVMESASEEELVILKRSIQSMGGENVTGAVASTVPSANDKAKVALLEILASRAAEEQIDVVFGEVNNANPEIKKAALETLSAMVTPKHLDKLVELLKNEHKEESLEKIQDAMIVANAQKNNPGTQTQWALDLIPQLEVEKQVYIYKVLSTTGGEEALENLESFYQSGSGIQKTEIVKALNQAEDPLAAAVLLNIARSSETENLREEALKGYIKLVEASEQEDEGKVILLRNALDLAKNNETIQAALTQLGNYPTFQALLVAGKHLDHPSHQQSAAREVMNIVLNNDKIHGEVVREIVQKTKEVISGQDSQYYKTSLQKYLDEMPKGKGFTPLFNGENLEGWKGLVANPIKRAAMNERTLAREQRKANEEMKKGWTVEDELLIFTGEGQNIVTEEEYGDFEMFIDWKITEQGDAGIYLRGTPQVQIWDIARTEVGAEVGSGGLYNNQSHPSKPLMVADNPVGEWNTFHIIMKGEKVTVYLNGKLVTDNVTLENYWDRTAPLFPEEQIELQAHGTYVAYRDIYIKELTADKFVLSEAEKAEGFNMLFDGTDLDQWTGNKTDYVVEDGVLAIYPDRGGSGNLMTKKEYDDFEFR
ncbi:MAG: family 16 glycoside hydrolase, partial [Cyclobacteriaceae bacterium]